MDGLDKVTIQVLPDGRVSRMNAATLLGKSSKTLAEWQRLGIGPKSFLVGGRRFYWLAELQSYASGQTPVRPLND
ncbi:hypothetical protein GCM10023115_05740 [Pontixanthobacter gangjinensis]|uniref:DNA-binding protein n=1 Tax=Pontixanthobacter gangjinensis TaxID=1028742 RepID=UPI001F289B79|nr:DNA-binding protein [Pontixanthobacter gangjinensis]